MTLLETLEATYLWADQRSTELLFASAAMPVIGTFLARVGKAGKSDAEGRFIASALVGVGLLAVLVEVLAVAVGVGLLERRLLDANVVLLVAPLVCLAGCLVGARLVFPLSELGSVRTVIDLGAFVAACAAVIWLASQFRGFGVLFLGNLFELLVLLALTALVLHRLYRRAAGRRPRPPRLGS